MTPTTPFTFQLGDPVEHRGIVITPLFPARDPVAAYITLDEALPRGLYDHRDLRLRLRARARRDQPARRERAALRRRGARRREAEPHPQRVGARRRRREAADPRLVRRAGPLEPLLGRLRRGDPHLARAPAPAQGRDARGAAAGPRRRAERGVERDRREAGAHVGRLADRREPRHVRGVRRPAAQARGRVPAGARSVRRRARDRRRAVPGHRVSAGGVHRAVAEAPSRATCSTRSSGSTSDPPTSSALPASSTRSRMRPSTRGPSAGLGEDVRLRGPGVIGSGLELDGELIQLSAFTSSDGGQRAFGRIARPSRRR